MLRANYINILSGIIFLCVIMITLSAAATIEALAQHKSAMAVPATVPPSPCTGDFDWIQLKNGEWLKGEIKGLLQDKFSFESDKLDTFELDWDDIYAVCSPRLNTLVMDGRAIALGALHIEGDSILVTMSDGERHFTRADLQSIIPGGVKERDYWSGKWSLGMTARSGNTNQTDISTHILVQRRSPRLRTLFEYTANFGSYEGIESINNQQANVRNDIFFYDSRWYFILPFIDYYQDKYQNIDYKLTPGAGAGWQIIDHKEMSWDIFGGGGYQYTKYSQVEAGKDDSEGGMTLIAGTNFNWDMTDNLDLKLNYRMMIGLSESTTNSQHTLLTFSIDMWKDLDLELSLTWDRVDNPQPTEDGTVPKKDDFRTQAGVTWEF